jgi:hypothetical protein
MKEDIGSLISYALIAFCVVFVSISFPPSMLRLAEVDGRLCLASRMELASVRNGLLVPAAGGKP